MNTATDLSSSEVLVRIRELERECEEILRVLMDRGQIVAAYKMDDAVTGLHKTQSCWNKAINWEAK
jgi:hypothetical protein